MRDFHENVPNLYLFDFRIENIQDFMKRGVFVYLNGDRVIGDISGER